MIDAYADRKTSKEVFAEVLEVEFDAFDEGFNAYLRETYFDVMRVMPSYTRDDIEDLLDEVDLEPKNAGAHARLGIAYLQHRNVTDAEIHASRAIALDRTSAEAHLVLGQIFYRKERIDRARELLEKGFSLGATDYRSHLLLASIYRDHQRDPDRAAAQYEKAKETFPRNVDPGNPYLELARYHRDRGEPELALAEIESYLALNGEDYEHRLEAARAHLEADRNESAARYLREATETRITEPELHQLLADTERKLGNLDAALLEYRSLLELSPRENHPPIYTTMAEIRIARGEVRDARGLLEEALAIDPDHADAAKLLQSLDE